jgi:beta-mannanase
MYLPATFDALKWSNVLFYLNMQYDVHLVIEFMKGDDPLTDICNGVYDKLLVAFASTANTYSGQQKVYIRPLHEANAFWYAWGVFKNSPGKQKIPTYLAAYKRIVKLMRITAPGKFLFEQHYTPTNLGNTVYVPLKELYAGDAYVDRVTTSVYNTCGTSTQTIRSFIDIFNTWYYQITAISSKPIGIGEIGSTSYCGVDKSAWLTDAWFELAHKYTRVESIDWFLENKQFGKTLKDWDTNSPSDVKAFANGWHALKQATTP